MTDNLWPTDFGDVSVTTPLAILREQAKGLGERTANVVVGRVNTVGAPEGRFAHILSLYCAPLNFSIDLLIIRHGIEMYPVQVDLAIENRSLKANDPSEFINALKTIFSSEATKKTIASLLAQSKQ